jgi:hypothetical protein
VAEGVPYVIAAYAVAGVTLAAWFWMIVPKLRRQRTRSEADDAA